MQRLIAQRGPARGFTLLELLVVVLIISVLIGILVPTVSQARTTARRAACGEQLRGLGVGVQAYLSENNFVLPISAQMPSVNTTREPLPKTLDREVPAAKSWRCPGDVNSYARIDGQTFASYFDGETLSYEYNMSLGGRKVERWFLHSLLGDAGTFVLADFDSFHNANKAADNAKNLLYADGHVAGLEDILLKVGGATPTTRP